ncbi:peptidoglycan D,D-transpeptidase FtsI family protein [Chakrabartyella piscis]|uniref:peptidoglycan D,D-transpeptidase FtsI family protein n=1 Tax=Chakrabartyella piscis TaxID=2918914 RepID=UPI0029587DB1|nr:penicillin-binding transpeptidase domain-containing protein [Chakrabartyella piscis]
MNNMKKSIRRVFWILAICFFLLFGYMVHLVVVQRDGIITNSYNVRLNRDDATIQRGSIVDCDGMVIARSVLQADGTYVREYPRYRMSAHITGYNSMGKAGLELSENFTLLNLHNEILQRVQSVALGTELVGDSIQLTIDMDIQSLAGDLLGSANGAIVVMEPDTGKVLAMQAYPDYDPNTIAADWSSLREDENSPLVNRGTQGLYPPGSTFKLMTALYIMQNYDNWEDIQYTCTGEASFANKTIRCYGNTAHGDLDLNGALTVSCNCFFAEYATQLGQDDLLDTMLDMSMLDKIPFDVATSLNRIGLSGDSTESELVETSIGQGNTLVTPLYMAMFASAIANDGEMMTPYMVDRVIYSDGSYGSSASPDVFQKIMSDEEADLLTDMMVSVVSSGTGTAAQISGYTVAGKTGTAENATGNDHSWFIGFAPAEDPQVAVAVLIENSDKYGKATPIAKQMLEFALNQ